MQFNDNLATRRALDQRPRPLREFSVGDEVAVWRRGTGKGAPGKQRRAQWRGPGIILGAVRGNYFVVMPGSVIKAAPEQLRHRTDRVVLRDLRRAADRIGERFKLYGFLSTHFFPCLNPIFKNVSFCPSSPRVCDTFRFESPPLHGKMIEFGNHDN